MGEFFSSINLGQVFISCFAFGLFFSLLRFIFGFGHDVDIEHDHDFDHDHDADHDVATSPHILSLRMILGYMVGFGGGGMIAYYQYEQPSGICILAGTGGMIALGIIVYYMFKVFYSQQSSSTVPKTEEFIGTAATVTTSIPAEEGRVGEVVCIIRNAKQYHPAKSKNGIAVKKGSEVIIVDIKDGKVIVK